MATYLFVWNPKRWHQWNDLDQEIEQVGMTGRADSTWSTGNRKNLPIGSRFFLIRLGTEPKGIMGSGVNVVRALLRASLGPSQTYRGGALRGFVV